jgi:hypothetical protein
MSQLLRFTPVGWMICVVTACSSRPTSVIKPPDLRLPEAVLGAMLLGERDGAVLDRMTRSSLTKSGATVLPPSSVSTPIRDDGNGDSDNPASGDESPKTRLAAISSIDEQVTRFDGESNRESKPVTSDIQSASSSETTASRAQVLMRELRSLNEPAEAPTGTTGNPATALPQERHPESDPSATAQPMTDNPNTANPAGNGSSEPAVLPPDRAPDFARLANRGAEEQAQGEVPDQVAAIYGAGSGFTGVTAGASSSTGVGAGNGYTGDGAGNGSTGVGAGNGYTGDGAGNGSTGVGAGNGYTGDGAGNGWTGVGAGATGSTGIAAERAGPSDLATCRNTEFYGGWAVIFFSTPYGPMPMPFAVQ